MFACKAGVYPSETFINCEPSKVKRLTRDKHSSLFSPSVSDGEKSYTESALEQFIVGLLKSVK